ncbi:MAG: hypothetical protein JW779_10500 [Candidatus Thorarchaeota archaeon]|nr:hypothetical protein [Candidatus Thorarchaeota archaeon]
MYTILKLSKTIKDEHEIYLAQLEIESITGKKPEPIVNLVDELHIEPFKSFMNRISSEPIIESIRFQDYFLFEVAYGPTQGFRVDVDDESVVQKLQRRLAYTSEIYAIGDRKVSSLEKSEMLGIDRQVFAIGEKRAIRLIAHQFFIEMSEYILKVTKTLPTLTMEKFFDRIVSSRFNMLKRIPASAGARVGKRLLDYVAERKEPSLYLSHALYPYKGRFHPRLAKALVNIVHPQERGIVIDCFSGSGTSLIETNLMGLDGIGMDINPVAIAVAQSKTDLLSMTDDSLEYYRQYCDVVQDYREDLGGIRSEESQGILKHDMTKFSDLIWIKQFIMRSPDCLKPLLELGLTMAISSQKKKKKKTDAFALFSDRCQLIYRTGILSSIIRRKLGVNHGRSVIVRGDASDIGVFRKLGPMRAGVNSPPYSTAIDYIGNDLEQMILMGFIQSEEDLQTLDQRLAGNPRRKSRKCNIELIPTDYGKTLVKALVDFGRSREAMSIAEFILFLDRSLEAQTSTLVHGSRIAIVIGNNHLKISDERVASTGTGELYLLDDAHFEKSARSILLTQQDLLSLLVDTRLKATFNSRGRSRSNHGTFLEVENDRILIELGSNHGLNPKMYLKRPLEKSLRGNIRYESIVLFHRERLDTTSESTHPNTNVNENIHERSHIEMSFE